MWKTIYNFITPIVIAALIWGNIQQCTRANKAENTLANKTETFNKADEIVDNYINSDSNSVTSSKPSLINSEDLEKGVAPSIEMLVDSVAQKLNLPSNQKPRYYTQVPISSSTSGKAKFKGDTAYLENDNWYLSYNYSDSTLYGRYNTVYNQYDYVTRNTFLGVPFGKENYLQDRWLNDIKGNIGIPKTVIIEEPKKESLIKLAAESKFRSFDNSILSGGTTEIGRGRFKIGGGYFYNFNTDKPEYEIKGKFYILK